MTFTPGCFGSPLCFSDVSLPCTLCPHQADCGPAAEVCAVALRETYGIRDTIVAANRAINRRPGKRPPAWQTASVATPAKVAPVLPRSGALAGVPHVSAAPIAPGSKTLSVKSLELQARLMKQGVDLPRAIGRGVNPFDAKPPAFMRVMVGMLLEGDFTRDQAVKRLMTDLSWAEASAASHVGLTLPVLVAAGVARVENNRIVKEIRNG